MKIKTATEIMEYGISHQASYIENEEKVFTVSLDIVRNYEKIKNNEMLKEAIEYLDSGTIDKDSKFFVSPSHGTVHLKSCEIHNKSNFSIQKVSELIGCLIYFSTEAGVVADLNAFGKNIDILEHLDFKPFEEVFPDSCIENNIIIASGEWFNIEEVN